MQSNKGSLPGARGRGLQRGGRRHRIGGAMLVAALLAMLSGCGGGGGGGGDADLSTADASGVDKQALRAAPDRGEILFLPNLDDDSKRCVLPEDLFTRPHEDAAFDRELAACNDAADEIVNGEADLADMAPLQWVPMRKAPEGAQVVLSGAPANAVRLFVRDGTGFRVFDPARETVPRRLLQAGLDLRVEGRDILRGPGWDGRLTLTLRLPDGKADTVRLRQAPLLLQHNLQELREVLTGNTPPPMSREFFLETVGDDPFYTYEVYLQEHERQFMVPFKTFRDSLDAARVASGLQAPLKVQDTFGDRWAQDLFEPGYASMPGPDGKPHVMRVLIRAASPTRVSARSVFALRGPDVGVVYHYSEDRPNTVREGMNSMGNLEALPPHSVRGVDYPAGRMLIGSGPGGTPDPALVAMLAAQRLQPVLEVDTSWLIVGHVDEIVHVLPGANGRRWTLAVPDPRMALKILQDAQAAGHGSATLFTGRQSNPMVPGGSQAEISIDEVLANARLLAENEKAAVHLDRVIARLLRETGLRDRDLVKLPVLYKQVDLGIPVEQRMSGPRKQIAALNPNVRLALAAGDRQPVVFEAFSPNLVNGLLLPNGVFAHTRPQGPVVNGVDLFSRATASALAKVGLRSAEVEAWDWIHVGGGEVHCATNAFRDPGADAAWWRAPGAGASSWRRQDL